MNQIKWVFAFIVICTMGNTYAANHHQGGKIYDITSTRDGLLIRLEGKIVPTKCPNPNGRGWMLIPEENKTMISVALTHFMQGKTNATIYTQGTVGSYCRVIQYDPHHKL
ncbi:MAG: hypothetical protein P8J25_03780 [Porticoccaceae bacterium]|nr:hypothetical protein [Porticoccaceae bacterium]